MEISTADIAQLYNTVSKMMCFMRDVEQSTYNNSQICEELYKRVEALEANQPKESVKEFLYSLRRSNNEQWNRIAALEAKAEKKLAAAEYNAYEAGYRAASGGEPSPEHKAAISKPINKAEKPKHSTVIGGAVVHCEEVTDEQKRMLSGLTVKAQPEENALTLGGAEKMLLSGLVGKGLPAPEVKPIHVGASDDSPTKQSIIFNDCESVKKGFQTH